jgi:Tfp pilus assembly protein PilX
MLTLMSGNYRDESSAAMAANEALRQENDEFKAKLADAERQQQALQAMHQQQLALAQQGYAPVAPPPVTRATCR